MVKRIALLGLVALTVGLAGAQEELVQQVNVCAKVIEFKASKDVETGFSAYFKRRAVNRDSWGRVLDRETLVINSADLTFPGGLPGGISVFLDRIGLNTGDVELVLQALVDQNRATILSRPRAMVAVGSSVPTVIKTVQSVPYDNVQMVGITPYRITSFRDTGVTLSVTCPQVIDDDGNPVTTDDTYIQLNIHAEVMDPTLGRTVTIQAGQPIKVPEFTSRSVNTHVWVRHGQVLVLGGLYRNRKMKSISSVPWLAGGEDAVIRAAERVVPVNMPTHPISSTLGNRWTKDERRELVFLIKAEFWRPSYALTEEFRFEDFEEETTGSPDDLITDVVEDTAEETAGQDSEQSGARDTEGEG